MAYHSAHELKPGVWHLTDAHLLRYYPGDRHPGWTEREISVDPQQWPFEAGETPVVYARRVVAAVDDEGEMFDVQMFGDVSWGIRIGKPTHDERITIKYRTPKKG